MNSAPIETFATAPNTIMALLGGMIMPIRADEVTTPSENRSPYPAWINAGYRMPPTATMVVRWSR